ncbi:MAG: hypothetical protein J6B03_11985 [Candidatus Homeothermus sp.]|nr:hypothetical protein [Candidatus Homeothermus sp.]
MTPNIEELITLNYELEGLLYLALHRGDDTPEKVWEMISEKIDSLKAGIDIRESEAAPVVEETGEEPAVMTEIIVEKEEPVIFEQETPEEETGEEEVVAVEETVPAEEVTLASEPATSVEQPAPAEEPVTEAAPVAELRLDEKLARQNSRDLRKAFSLNDRFRFRRELFGNSDERMNEALHAVESMATIDEAHDYFYNSLGLDKTSTDVADFIAVIEHHISAK